MSSDSCSESLSDTDESGNPGVGGGGRKFSAAQSSKLNDLYHSGMRGVGKKYQYFFKDATLHTNLSLNQVKVNLIEMHLHEYMCS